MLCAGYNVELDVLNATVVGLVLNSSLPSIQVMPPQPPMNTTPASLLMTLDITSSALLPFTVDKQRILTGAVIQVGCSVLSDLVLTLEEWYDI